MNLALDRDREARALKGQKRKLYIKMGSKCQKAVIWHHHYYNLFLVDDKKSFSDFT